ncbi:MAG: alpha/beta family hydrolase [Pseudomonadota bacterium]|nr:alpha/beta family hydrolase [Pseudomonadota bacterium]
MKETHTRIAGPAGQIEARFSDTGAERTAILCHPHPQFGGTMDNKVVHTLTRALGQAGLNTVRFNFRGVGASEGDYGEGIAEQDDLRAVAAWCACNGAKALWLGGFSFGAFVAASVASKWTCDAPLGQLILVAPPVGRFDFSGLDAFPAPLTVLQGQQDDVVSATEVAAWVEQVHSPAHLISFPTAGHFFHGQLVQLKNQLLAQLTESGAGL